MFIQSLAVLVREAQNPQMTFLGGEKHSISVAHVVFFLYCLIDAKEKYKVKLNLNL